MKTKIKNKAYHATGDYKTTFFASASAPFSPLGSTTLAPIHPRK